MELVDNQCRSYLRLETFFESIETPYALSVNEDFVLQRTEYGEALE